MSTTLRSSADLPPAGVQLAGASVRTWEITDPQTLLNRLPDVDSLAWVRRGEGLIGWGVVASLQVTGDERFSRAQRWWHEWLRTAHIDDPIKQAGTGPVAFASFTFDPNASQDPDVGDAALSQVVIPRVILGRRDGRAWITVIETSTAPSATTPDETDLLTPVSLPLKPVDITWQEGSVSAEDWQKAVSGAIDRIHEGELDKVVLARDVVATSSAPIDPRYLLQRLGEDYPECWTFQVAGLIGATPELLVRRNGDEVTSRVLAGTVNRLGDESGDASLATALLGSGKDLAEHEYAVRSVARSLSTHCTDLHVPARPRVLRLPNVQHLATDVTGQLVDNAPVLALAASLHPTAAVCGTPTERAFALISDLEGMDRQRYAGPVGWFDSRGDGEFGIALRCAQLSSDRRSLRLFAGCGIVAGSDPELELAESQAKFLPIQQSVDFPRLGDTSAPHRDLQPPD